MIVIRQFFQEKKISIWISAFRWFLYNLRTVISTVYQQFFMCFNNNCTILFKNLIEQKKKNDVENMDTKISYCLRNWKRKKVTNNKYKNVNINF